MICGIKFCRTCYGHLAGFAGVRITEAFEEKGYIRKTETAFFVTEDGWKWLSDFHITRDDFRNKRRPLTRQCLDGSEHRPHLAGQLGAVLLEKMLQMEWFKRVPASRALVVTPKGKQELADILGVYL